MSIIQHVPTLTNRELQVLAWISLGYSAKEAAQKCGIAFRTIETHLDKIRLKLRARNRTHMVAIALKLGMLSETEFQTQAEPPLAA